MQKESLTEKRQTIRAQVALSVNYEMLETPDKRSGNTIAKDISENGIRLITERFYPPKSKFLVRISLADINKTIEAIAETVWSFNARFSNQYVNGLCFTDMDKPYRQILKDYLLTCGLKPSIPE